MCIFTAPRLSARSHAGHVTDRIINSRLLTKANSFGQAVRTVSLDPLDATLYAASEAQAPSVLHLELSLKTHRKKKWGFPGDCRQQAVLALLVLPPSNADFASQPPKTSRGSNHFLHGSISDSCGEPLQRSSILAWLLNYVPSRSLPMGKRTFLFTVIARSLRKIDLQILCRQMLRDRSLKSRCHRDRACPKACTCTASARTSNKLEPRRNRTSTN